MHVNKFLQHFVMHNHNMHPPFLLFFFFFPPSHVCLRGRSIYERVCSSSHFQCHSSRETGYGAVRFQFGGCNPMESVRSLGAVTDASMFPSLFISEVLHLSLSLDVSLEFRHLEQMRIPLEIRNYLKLPHSLILHYILV